MVRADQNVDVQRPVPGEMRRLSRFSSVAKASRNPVALRAELMPPGRNWVCQSSLLYVNDDERLIGFPD